MGKRTFTSEQQRVKAMPNGDFIAYYRVSTARQGESGLGLDAQRKAVMQYLNGGNWSIIEEYTETESGKRNNRPKLQEALEACKKNKATLIIAKLDRLARNVHFISGLMESGIEFVAADNPHANKLMLHMLAAFAEHEREQISARTKDALAAAKARGVELGKNAKYTLAPNNKALAEKFACEMQDIIAEIKGRGIRNIRGITEELNLMSIPTSRNCGKWHVATVQKLINRIGSL